MFFCFCFVVVILFVVFFLSILCLLVMTKFYYGREKYSTFECGFDLLTSLRLPFSLHFFFISIIFLIFDVELVLFLPFIFVFKFYFFFLFFFFFYRFFFCFCSGIFLWVMGSSFELNCLEQYFI